MRTVSPFPSLGGLSPVLAERMRRVAWRRLPKSAWSVPIAVLREWRRRSRERAQLASLDDRMLRDIGISRGDMLAEINKPFWRR